MSLPFRSVLRVEGFVSKDGQIFLSVAAILFLKPTGHIVWLLLLSLKTYNLSFV